MKTPAKKPLPVCATCPWLVQNHGLPKPRSWYSTANLRRLWTGVRTGKAPGMVCHSTDPASHEYGGADNIKPGHERHCAGLLLLVMRNINAVGEDKPQPFQPGLQRHVMADYFGRQLFGDLPSVMYRDDVGLPWVPDFEAAKAVIEAKIAAHGFTLRYVEYCEDARTPGLLGQMRGVTDRERREVKIGRKANRSQAAMLNILRHELRHLDEPEWDCGNRDVLGRG